MGEVTISLENLEAHLVALSEEIKLEKHQRQIAQMQGFLNELGKDKETLFEMIQLFKEKKSIRELTIDHSPEQLPNEPLENHPPKNSDQVGKEIEVSITTSKETWNKFTKAVALSKFDQKDCVNLALNLFIDHCHSDLEVGSPIEGSAKSGLF